MMAKLEIDKEEVSKKEAILAETSKEANEKAEEAKKLK
jgi:hypothetical protein